MDYLPRRWVTQNCKHLGRNIIASLISWHYDSFPPGKSDGAFWLNGKKHDSLRLWVCDVLRSINCMYLYTPLLAQYDRSTTSRLSPPQSHMAAITIARNPTPRGARLVKLRSVSFWIFLGTRRFAIYNPSTDPLGGRYTLRSLYGELGRSES